MKRSHPLAAVGYEAYPWERSATAVGSRRAIRNSAGPYRAAVPAPVADLRLTLSDEVLALADDAITAIARFDSTTGTIVAPFSSILLRTESASSSEVEHITSSAKQLALAEIGQASSENARLVASNVRAMEAALAFSIHLDEGSVLAMHEALLRDHDPGITGGWRREQVWIGGGGVSPHSAEFVPPHHERVPALMTDLMDFVQRTDLPVLAQIAIAHAQFETIHPFPDGNGRTGRALVQGMLRGSRVTQDVTVPVSAGLLGDLGGYFGALDEYRRGDAAPIVRALAEASFAAVRNGHQLVEELQAARARWQTVVVARADSSAHRLKALLLRQPVVTNRVVSEQLGVSDVAAQTAIDRLVGAGVLTSAGGGVRYRRWQADEVLDALDAFGARAKRGAGRG